MTNQNWSYRNVVLLGDALRTVHFSVGSGTRMALQDSITLALALAETDTVERGPAPVRTYSASTGGGVSPAATDSYQWYEHFREKLSLDPVPFTYDYVMRSGRITHQRLKERSPQLAAAHETYLSERRSGGAGREGNTIMLEGFTPWPAELASRYRERGYWRDEPLGDIVDSGAERFGTRRP